MKKFYNIGILFILISQSATFAQSFEFYESNNEGEILAEIANNDTVFYEVDYSEIEECYYFLYQNVSGSFIEYDLKLEIFELAEDVLAYYAFDEGEFLLDGFAGVPYSAIMNTEQSLDHDSLDHFRICYRQEVPGRTIYRISFVDPTNSDIKMGSIYVIFQQYEGLYVNEQGESQEMTIFPNPSNGICKIEIQQAANIQVTDMLGQVVHSETLQSGTTTMDLSHLQKGIYHISFFDPVSNEYQLTKKWVVQ